MFLYFPSICYKFLVRFITVLTNLLGIELGGGRDLAPEVLVLTKISGPTLGCSDWWIFVYTSKDVTRRYTF